MQYDNHSVRRQDRLLDQPRADELLRSQEFGILSMIDEHGTPYGIPVNFVWDGGDTLYVHCAPEGKKLRAIARNSAVSFCVVGHVRLAPSKFTTAYESVLVSGTASVVLDEAEREHAVRLLLRKLSPDDFDAGLRYAARSMPRTAFIRIRCTTYSGKQKILHTSDVPRN